MDAQNPFEVIGDEVFDQPGQVARRLDIDGLEMLNEQQFMVEFHNLSELDHHANILPYAGYNFVERLVFCQHHGISLDVLLPDFGWPIHYRVIRGIVSGLHFLHDFARPDDPIYHLDLRLCNIFCEIDMQPKIAFFGLSRLFAPDPVPGNNVPRPYGYVAPEYQIRGEITGQSDVFGLGILMLEILTGQRFPLNNPDAIQGNIALVRENWSNVQRIQIRYPQLNDAGIMQVMGCIAIAIECVDINPNRRPTAGRIVHMVDNAGRPPFDNNLMMYCINQSNNPRGKIGYMLSTRALRLEQSNGWALRPNPGGSARLPERAELPETTRFRISGEIATKHLMLDTIYRVYLVYALAPNHSCHDGSEHRSAIQLRAGVPEDQIGFLASGERRVRLVLPPPADGVDESDVIYPTGMGDNGRMSLELGMFQVGPEHVQGPHAVIAQLSIVSGGGGVAVRGLNVEGMEFRPF